MRERWRDVIGYESFYKVSDRGTVRSVTRRVRHRAGTRIAPGRVLRPGKLGDYLVVNLSREGKAKIFLVQWLVLEAFVGPRPDGKQALHKDDDPANNSVENLYWGTRGNNAQDAIRNGRMPVGEDKHGARSTNDEVRRVRTIYDTGQYTQVGLAKIFGRSFVWVHNVVRRKKWKHI